MPNSAIGLTSPFGNVIFLPIEDDMITQPVADSSCESGCSYTLTRRLKIVGVGIHKIVVTLPRLSNSSSIDKKRFEKVYQAIKAHELAHVESLKALDANYADFTNPGAKISFQIKICVENSDSEIQKLIEDAYRQMEEKVLNHLNRKLESSVHQSCGDSFDSAKLIDYLLGVRDDF